MSHHHHHHGGAQIERPDRGFGSFFIKVAVWLGIVLVGLVVAIVLILGRQTYGVLVWFCMWTWGYVYATRNYLLKKRK